MRRVRFVGNQVGLLVTLSVLAGLLVAGFVLPVVGALGLAAGAVNSALAKLPSYLNEPPLAQHSVLRAEDGSIIATLDGSEDRVVVPLSDIPAVMQKAIVAIEDNRFFQHHGVDIRGVLRALRTDSSAGGFAQGASTITQQYVKQVLLEQASNSLADPAAKLAAEQAATEKSINRKLREARLAIALEKRLTKDQILERYLNIAYFGEGVYGVGTAARHYFGISVRQLSLAQAALLAGVVNDPSRFDPVAHPHAATARRNEVLDAIAHYHFLPLAQTEAAKRQPLVVHPTQRAVDACSVTSAPFFCRYALGELLADPALGATQAERDNTVYEGGLNIYTSFDPRVQRAVDTGIATHLPDNIRQLMSVVVEQPGTGRILAIGQNRKYGTRPGESKEVFATAETQDVGSSFKAFTLAAALEAGTPLSTRIASPPCLNLPEYAGHGHGNCPNGVGNAGDSEACNCDLYTGTWDSVNTFYIQLEKRVGVSTVAAMAARLGVTGSARFQAGDYGTSLTLGTAGGLSVIDMVNGYSTLAAHGLECTPTVIDRITTLTGASVPFSTAPLCHQVLDPGIADTVTSVLQGVLTQPGATGFGLGIGRPAAAKTGTLDFSDGAWFVGYVPQYTTAIGLFDPLQENSPATPLCDLTGPCYQGSTLYGATIPGHTWQTIMEAVVAGEPVVDFPLPPATDVGTPLTVPNVAGLTPAVAAQQLMTYGFQPLVNSIPVDSTQPAGTVAGTNPPAGSPAAAGTTVTLLVSNGHPPPVSPTTSPPPPSGFVPVPPPPSPSSPPSPTGSPHKRHSNVAR